MEIMKAVGNIIESEIRVYNKVDINLSGIFSHLIKEVGTLVKAYQSDLYYDLKTIEDDVKNMRNGVHCIGLRETGVDGDTFCSCRKYEGYLKLFVIVIDVDEINHTITVTLNQL